MTIADQMLQALGFCHDFGIVHGDVKTANILRYDAQSHDNFKLCDFGLATKIGEGGVRVGPTQDGDGKYLAPEALNWRRDGDYRKTDVYSLGVSLLEMARQVKPTREDNHTFSQSENPYEDFPELKTFSLQFLFWIQTLMNFDPERRAGVSRALVSLRMLIQARAFTRAAASTSIAQTSVSSPTASSRATSSASALTTPPQKGANGSNSNGHHVHSPDIVTPFSKMTLHSQKMQQEMVAAGVHSSPASPGGTDARDKLILQLQAQVKELQLRLAMRK